MDKQDVYLQHIRNVAPTLELHTVRLHTSDGQFNDILIVNDELIFRFPRSFHAAKALIHEVAILSKIQNTTTLPIPHPIYVRTNSEVAHENFMGYRMIPGEPLFNRVLDAIEDNSVLERLAVQIATFLQELHRIPTKDRGLDLPLSDTHDGWLHMYQQFRAKLFPYMRPDACEEVTHNFDLFLNDSRHFAYTPVFRHGDFGGSNILYDAKTQRITGVIDFSFAGLGDPALDLAAISTCGDPFFQQVRNAYPASNILVERAQFYKSTYALQQALYALRDNDRESFEDGIAQYI